MGCDAHWKEGGELSPGNPWERGDAGHDRFGDLAGRCTGVCVCVCVILCVLTRNYWQAFLDKTRQKVTLSEKIQLSHDTYIYRFALPKKNMMLGLPVGKHFKVRT